MPRFSVDCARLWAVVTMVALAGCAGARPHPSASSEPPPQALMPGPPASSPGGSVPPGSTPSRAAALNSLLLSHASPPTAGADLPIGPGDLVEVSIFEVQELSGLKLRVPLRGNITLPLLGPIPAAGRTAIELEDEIRQRLRQKYMHDPYVSVFVHEHPSQRISVIGAVRQGGVFTLTGRLRLADGLGLAQGLTDEADHVIYLIRRVPSGTVARNIAADGSGSVAPRASGVPPRPADVTEEVMVPIDLEALTGGREDLNVELQAGDVIHVPRAGSFYVGGSVERPGSFFLKTRTTVDQAILAAGGVKDVADWEDVRLYRTKPGREREVITLNLNEFEKGRPFPEVQRNDVIIVGKSGSKAFWYGFVDFFKGIFGVSKGL